MTKEQFEALEESLYKKGYKKQNQQWHDEDYVIGKGFHKKDNKWEENRNAYQLLLSIYDWTNPNKVFYDNLPESMKKRVGIEIHIDVSRTIDERIELTMPWNEDTDIMEVEAQAEGFYKWINSTWSVPREEPKKE